MRYLEQNNAQKLTPRHVLHKSVLNFNENIFSKLIIFAHISGGGNIIIYLSPAYFWSLCGHKSYFDLGSGQTAKIGNYEGFE